MVNSRCDGPVAAATFRFWNASLSWKGSKRGSLNTVGELIDELSELCYRPGNVGRQALSLQEDVIHDRQIRPLVETETAVQSIAQ